MIRSWFVIVSIGAMLLVSGCSGLGGGSSNKHSEEVRDGRQVVSALKIALQAQNDNDLDTAADAFQQMISLGAKSADALNHYAIFLREQWKIEEAESVYLTALKYSPNNAMTHFNLAVLYDVYLGKFAQAVNHYKLYKKHAVVPDKRIKGWVVDLERRAKQAAVQSNQQRNGGSS